MKTALAACAATALLIGACADHRIIQETPLTDGAKLDPDAIYLGWIDFGGPEEFYKHGYQNKEGWLQFVATLNQSYTNWIGTYDGARSPKDKPGQGKILVRVSDVRIPAELRDGDKQVTAVVSLEQVGSGKKIYQATVRLEADSWGFESALNQAVYNLAKFVQKRLGQLTR